MPKGNTFINDFLTHVFCNSAIPLIGDATGLPGAATVGSLYVSLHTADPTLSGNQNTSEISYTGYARVAVARTAVAWTVASQQVQNAAAVIFGACTGGSGIATYAAVGTASSGTGKILYVGALGSSLSISNNITPQINAAGITLTES